MDQYFPHLAKTKPIETRMGKGKDLWRMGSSSRKIMFEIDGVSKDVAHEALRLASHKLPIKTKFISKENGGEKDENKWNKKINHWRIND